MQKNRILLPLFALLACGLLAPAAQAEKKNTPIGKRIENFSLRDYRGKMHSLDDYADSKLIVVAFLGTDCPLVKLYGPRLEEFSEKYAEQGVTFIAINSNRQDPPTKIGAYAKLYGMTFPILKDPDNKIADVFGAIRTPEMFVLDENRTVRYWGRIDDQYGFTTGVGYGRPKMSKTDLIDAVDELLAGKEVSVPTTEAPGCIIGRVPKVEPHGDVTYSNQIARILQQNCVECHREGEIGPFPLASFEEVNGWGGMIREVVEEGRMPPWYANPEHGRKFANDARLSEEEKQLIYDWVDNGEPEGDSADLPEPIEFATGWRIPEPDVVLYMSDEPFQVPAEGVVDYQYFTVDPGFTEDKWVKAIEARPDKHSVVHHIIVFVETPGKRGFRRNGALIGYAPGMPGRVYPEGVGLRLPAGSRFVFQMHYTPVGTPEADRSSVGIVFADEEEIKYELKGGACGNFFLEIPPGDPNHVVKARTRLRRDTVLLSFMPHMHLRGKSFRYELEYPDGTREILLDVPRYDFNWQLWYDLEEPLLLPKGSKIHCTASFDNSEDNVYNPDPSATVLFGDQTWDEMMIGFFSTIVPREPEEEESTGSGD